MPETGEKRAFDALKRLLDGLDYCDELRSFVLRNDALYDAAREAVNALKPQKGAR